jgi:hypothetical protein
LLPSEERPVYFSNETHEIFELPSTPENLSKTCDPDSCAVPSEARRYGVHSR